MNIKFKFYAPVIISNSAGKEYGFYNLGESEHEVPQVNILGLTNEKFSSFEMHSSSLEELAENFHTMFQNTSEDSGIIILWKNQMDFSYVDKGVRPCYSFYLYRNFTRKEKKQFIKIFNEMVKIKDGS